MLHARTIALFLFLLTSGHAAADDVVRDGGARFALRLQPGWLEAPQEAVAEANRFIDEAVRDRTGAYRAVVYTENRDWFERPYVLVQAQAHDTPLLSMRDLRVFMRGAGESLMEPLGGREPIERPETSEGAADALAGLRWWMDEDAGLAVWATETGAGDPQGGGATGFVASVMHVGIESAVTVHGYFDAPPERDRLASFLEMAHTLEFEPGVRTKDLQAEAFPGADVERRGGLPVGVMAAFGALLGVCVAIVVLSLRRSREGGASPDS